MNEPYQISCSQSVLETVRFLRKQCRYRGLESRFFTALRKIESRLKSEPLIFGEPRFHLHSLGLEIRIGMIQPLVVWYGIHAENRVVFVRDFKLFPSWN